MKLDFTASKRRVVLADMARDMRDNASQQKLHADYGEGSPVILSAEQWEALARKLEGVSS